MNNIKNIFRYFTELRVDDSYEKEVNEILLSYKKMSYVDLANSLSSLNLNCKTTKIKFKNIQDEVLPCFIVSNSNVKNFCKKGDLLIYYYDKETKSKYILNDNNETLERKNFAIKEAILLKEYNESDLENEKIFENTSHHYQTWLKTLTRRFRNKIRLIYTLSLFNIITFLAVPFYVMFIYDKIVGSKDLDTLIPATTGVTALLIIDFAVRNIRSNIIVWCSNRLEYLLQTELLQKISMMSDYQLELEKIDNQINRFEDINNATDFFASPTSNLLLDTLFASLLIIPIFFLSWKMALPLVAIIPVYYFLYRRHNSNLRLNKQYYNEVATKKTNLTNELKRRSESIFLENVYPVFNNRLKNLTARSSTLSQKSQMAVHQLELLAYLFTIGVGILSISIGIFLVWERALATGSFMAIMLILWRILSPAQQLLNSKQRFDTINYTFKQLHHIFKSKSEARTFQSIDDLYINNLDIEFKGVCFRYPNTLENLFVGVDLKIRHGKIYGVHGGPDTGKDAFLKLINKTYMPQSGAITIGEVDNRQFDTALLRQSFMTLNLSNTLLKELSIYENIKYINPLITKKELLISMEIFGIRELLEENDITIDTPLVGEGNYNINQELYAALVLLIPLCCRAKVVLIEEISTTLINNQLPMLRKFLSMARDNFTVVFCSDHREILKETDRIIYMAQGAQIYSGEKTKILNALEERSLV